MIDDLARVGKRIYKGRVRKVGSEFGIDNYLKQIYWFANSISAEQVLTLDKNGRESRIMVYSDGTISPYHEKEIIEDVLSSTKDGDVFFDVGANFGRYCCVVSALYDEVEIIAVEPNPSTARILRENIKTNGLNGNVFECALSDAEGEMTLSMADTPERSRLNTSKNSKADDGISVRVKRGDSFIQEHGLNLPTIVKIDVEGAELDTITGMADTLKRQECRLLYCEVHPFLMQKFDSTEEELFTKLAEFGFEYETISKREVEYKNGKELQKFIKAEKEST